MLRCLLPLLAWPGLAWPAEIAGHTMGHIRMDANLTVEEMTCELPRAAAASAACCRHGFCCLLLLLRLHLLPPPAPLLLGYRRNSSRPAACL